MSFQRIFYLGVLCTTSFLSSCSSNQVGPSHLLIGATLIRPTEGVFPNAAIEITGERISGVYLNGNYPRDEPRTDLSGKFVMAGLTDSLSEMSTPCEAAQALRYGVTSVVATAGLDRQPINLGLSPSPVIYPMALIKSRTVGAVFTVEQLDEQVKEALVNNDGIRFIDLNKDMNTTQMHHLLDRLRDSPGIRINAELADADYYEALGVHNLLHTEWYFDPLAPAAIRALPNLQTNTSPLLTFYSTVDTGTTAFQDLSHFLAAHFVLTPALGLYGFHDFPSFAAFAAYYDAHNVCGIPMTRVNDQVFAAYEGSRWAESLVSMERVNHQNGARYLAASASPRFGTIPGLSLVQDLQTLVSKVGLSNDEALGAATLNFDAAYGLGSVGRVKSGYYANLVVMKKNPQENLDYLTTEIDAVYVKGKVVQR